MYPKSKNLYIFLAYIKKCPYLCSTKSNKFKSKTQTNQNLKSYESKSFSYYEGRLVNGTRV